MRKQRLHATRAAQQKVGDAATRRKPKPRARKKDLTGDRLSHALQDPISVDALAWCERCHLFEAQRDSALQELSVLLNSEVAITRFETARNAILRSVKDLLADLQEIETALTHALSRRKR